ncbi:MAG: hypothetical protein OXU53_11505 [Deltaproteobacteria bacterium]|nr:hypothetical protein [Deltaproteobacteria bacterium]
MSTETLTSLAMLKVKIDHGGNYLDYLQPFVVQVLVDHKSDRVTSEFVNGHILEQFGLVIPERTVQVVLKRLAKKRFLEREMGVYRVIKNLPNPNIDDKKRDAEKRIDSVVSGLKAYSESIRKPVSETEDAVKSICAFLSEFNISCLRAYLRETAIPSIVGNHKPDIVLVSKYILHLQKNDPYRFESFMQMVQGHMLANALLCPDLQTAPKAYQDVTFYFDTPLLIRLIGAEGPAKKRAIRGLVQLLHELKGNISAFSHSRHELDAVLDGAATYIDSRNGRGTIVLEARRVGATKSDLLLLKNQIDSKLSEFRIKIADTPPYIEKFQIDETEFEKHLDDEISYYNARAKQFDINSLRSIYAIRENLSPVSLEKCKAVLVTSNAGFARAAWKYGQKHQLSPEVSGVITDFSLANLAWLKAPMGAIDIPETEIFAYAYGALSPSRDFLEKFMNEIDKLEKGGQITVRDHQLLRSSSFVSDDLMELTLGDETALTSETIFETLERVKEEILDEEGGKLDEEKKQHENTRYALDSTKQKNHHIIRKIYWRCHRKAQICARVTIGLVVGLLIVPVIITGAFLRLGLLPMIPALFQYTIAFFVGLLALLGIWGGVNVKGVYPKIQAKFRNWFLKREAKILDIDIDEFANRK